MRLTGKYVRNLLMSVQRAEIGKENGEQNGDVYYRHRESDTPFSVLIVNVFKWKIQIPGILVFSENTN